MPEAQLSLLDLAGGLEFRGAVYSVHQDGTRLARQLEHVRQVVLEGLWLSDEELRGRIRDRFGKDYPTQSVARQRRYLREAENGGHRFERRRVREGGGTWQFRLAK